MPQFSSKADWLTQLETVKGLLQQNPDLTGRAIGKQMDISEAQASYFITLHGLLDQVAIQKIRSTRLPSANKALGQSNPVAQLEASQQMPTFSLQSALALAGLSKAETKDLNSLVHAALDMALAQKLPTVQIKALAAWMAAGNSAETFNPQPLSREPRGGKRSKTWEKAVNKRVSDDPSANKASHANGNINEPLAQSSHGSRLVASSQMDLNKIEQLLQKTKTERIQGTGTSAEEKLKAHILEVAETLKGGDTPEEPLLKTLALDWLADVNLIKQLQAKRKKGKSLTTGELSLLAVHKVWELFKGGLKLASKPFKPFFHILHFIWKLVIDALKELGIYKWVKAVFTLVMLVVALWFAWEAFHYGVMRPVEMIWSRIHFTHAAESPAVQEPTPSPVSSEELEVRSSKPKTPNSKLLTSNSTPVVSYQPAIAFVPTVYDPKLLEQEIAAIPDNSVIKDYVFQPDEGMPADLAASRLQDLTDADKYTMRIGSAKETIVSLSPSHTNFTLAYKSTDIVSIWGSGSGEMNFFWEDVKYIHINEIDHFSKPGAQPEVNYQCTLVVKGAKNPLTIQCASTDDLQNLVSTMEFFIRNSRLGHDAQPAGLPYPSQGLVFNNLCVVKKLWANSPADKAGLQLTDHLWSLDKATGDPQEKKDFEKGLSSLPVTIFAASDSDWNKATIAKNSGMTNVFRPKLRKTNLQP